MNTKQTEIGEIPADWEVVKLGECLKTAPKYGINAPAVALEGNLPVYIRITDISDDGFFMPSEKVGVRHAMAENYLLENGDLLLARTGASVGKSYLYNEKDGKLVFAGFLIKISPDNEKLDSVFLSQYLKTEKYWQWVATISMRSGQPGINATEYAGLQIPLPPFPEQTSIAAILSDTNHLLAALRALIGKKRAVKTAAMQQLLSGSLRLPEFATNGSLKNSELGEIPEDWKVVKLGEIVEIKKGDLITAANIRHGNIPVIAGGKKPAYYHDAANRFGKTITISASGANAGLVSFHCCDIFASDCSTISENQQYSIEFIYFTLLNKQSEIYKLQTGGAQPHIHPKDLNPLLITLPPLPEQTAIAQTLSDMDSEIAALEARAAKLAQIKQGLMQNLLTGKIRVNTGAA